MAVAAKQAEDGNCTGVPERMDIVRDGLHCVGGSECQADNNIEYVDGGLTDGMLDIYQDISPQHAYMTSEPDNGLYDAMDRGIDLATGAWVIFTNACYRFSAPDAVRRVIAGPIEDADLLFAAAGWYTFRACLHLQDTRPGRDTEGDDLQASESVLAALCLHKNCVSVWIEGSRLACLHHYCRPNGIETEALWRCYSGK
jgi:hypothetical protein